MKDIKQSETFGVDFGSGVCAARCNHCVFGTGKRKSKVSDEQILMYSRMEDYAKRRAALLTFGLMDPIESFDGSLHFVKEAGHLRFSTMDMTNYVADPKASLRRLKSIFKVPMKKASGINMSVHSERLFNNDLSADSLCQLAEFQLAAIKIFPGRDIHTGFRVNRSDEDLSKVSTVLTNIGLSYAHYMKYLYEGFTTTVKLYSNKGLVSLMADAEFKNGVRLGMAFRFISSKYGEEETSLAESAQLNGGIYGMALFPDEVHAFHTTMNIVDTTLRFKYDEFKLIMDEVEKSGRRMSDVVFEEVTRRRKKKVLKLVSV